MKATIKMYYGTGCAQIRIYDATGKLILIDYCTSYSRAEQIARSYNATITNIN